MGRNNRPQSHLTSSTKDKNKPESNEKQTFNNEVPTKVSSQTNNIPQRESDLSITQKTRDHFCHTRNTPDFPKDKDNYLPTVSSTTVNASDNLSLKTVICPVRGPITVLANDKDATIIYTDASVIQGVAGIGIYYGPKHPLNLSLRLPGYNHSNVYAEIIAAKIGLQNLHEWSEYNQSPVIVRTDCYEIINAMQQHNICGVNAEELIALKELALDFPKGVQFEHVYGHVGSQGNEAADMLAHGAISDARPHSRSRSRRPSYQMMRRTRKTYVIKDKFKEKRPHPRKEWARRSPSFIDVTDRRVNPSYSRNQDKNYEGESKFKKKDKTQEPVMNDSAVSMSRSTSRSSQNTNISAPDTPTSRNRVQLNGYSITWTPKRSSSVQTSDAHTASELAPLTFGIMSAANGEDSADRNVEMWKIKKLIKSLEMARGNGTSMISLIIPPRDQIARVSKMLADEYGTASNIKSRVNRLSVLGAITSVQARLKLYNKVPPNGLVVYCGTIVTDDGKEKKVNIDFEPFKPVNTSLYLCDNKFHTEALQALLTDDNKFGFIVMDGNGSLFGTLQGNTREVLHKFTVDLPKKHGRGGQSALRFARLRMEKRHNYVRKVAETAVEMFIRNDKVAVAGLILAGSADFKTELSQSDMFDQRLQAKIVKVVDISYGGENGFNQAIELSADALLNVKFIQEKKLIGNFFDEISQDSGKYVFGTQDTIQALEMGAVETLICWENLDITRMRLKKTNGDEKVINLRPDQLGDKKLMTDPDSGAEMEIIENLPLLEWLANNYKSFGAVLEIVTDKSQEGAQFVKGFGGIGGILRYRVDFQMLEAAEEDDIDLDDY